MDAKLVGESLKRSLGEEKILDIVDNVPDPFISISPDSVLDVAWTLYRNPELDFNVLMCLSGVDYPQNNAIEIVYHLYSMTHRHRITLKTRLIRDNPELPSVTQVWPAANFHEREVYDMLGVNFVGHPDLRRILLPDDWEGFPLRKDYQVQSEYHGIPVPYQVTSNDTEQGLWVFSDEMNWDNPNPPTPPPTQPKEVKS